MPVQQLVAEILFVRTSYVKKIIEDCSNSEETVKLLRFSCWENPQFSSTVLSELLWQVRVQHGCRVPPHRRDVRNPLKLILKVVRVQVAYSYTYELRPYLDLLLQILLIEDSWQTHRSDLDPAAVRPTQLLVWDLSRFLLSPLVLQDPQRVEGHPRRQRRALRHHPALKEPLPEAGLPVHQVHGGALQQLLRGLPDPPGGTQVVLGHRRDRVTVLIPGVPAEQRRPEAEVDVGGGVVGGRAGAEALHRKPSVHLQQLVSPGPEQRDLQRLLPGALPQRSHDPGQSLRAVSRRGKRPVTFDLSQSPR